MLVVPLAGVGGPDEVGCNPSRPFINFVQPTQRGHPQPIFMVFADVRNLVVQETVRRIVQVWLQRPEPVSVIFVETIVGAEPHEPLAILEDAVHRIVRQSIVHRQVLEDLIDVVVGQRHRCKRA